jgi:hypothetical protein
VSADSRALTPPLIEGHRSVLSAGAIRSAASAGSILSIGSAGSILSIGSAGSILSIGSAGSILSVGSCCSVLSVRSAFAILGRDDAFRIGRRRARPTAVPADRRHGMRVVTSLLIAALAAGLAVVSSRR